MDVDFCVSVGVTDGLAFLLELLSDFCFSRIDYIPDFLEQRGREELLHNLIVFIRFAFSSDPGDVYEMRFVYCASSFKYAAARWPGNLVQWFMIDVERYDKLAKHCSHA